jgi:hypothetical protein
MTSLQYPIGEFEYGKKYTASATKKNIKILEKFPAQFKKLALSLTEEQLQTPYRPEGWTAKQVIHHVADSHINMITRVKLLLTEENPTIKPYEEAEWAKLIDYDLPVKTSLNIIEGIHKRLVTILKTVDKTQLKRTYMHPETRRTFCLDEVIALYAWHSEHHYKHVESVK